MILLFVIINPVLSQAHVINSTLLTFKNVCIFASSGVSLLLTKDLPKLGAVFKTTSCNMKMFDFLLNLKCLLLLNLLSLVYTGKGNFFFLTFAKDITGPSKFLPFQCSCELSQFVLSCLSEASADEAAVAFSRKGITQRFEFINFKEHKFSFLNITALAKRVVKDSLSCAFSCLENLACFSFNVAAFPDNARKLTCEILSSDKYNNSENFLLSKTLHHFSIAVRNLRLFFS